MIDRKYRSPHGTRITLKLWRCRLTSDSQRLLTPHACKNAFINYFTLIPRKNKTKEKVQVLSLMMTQLREDLERKYKKGDMFVTTRDGPGWRRGRSGRPEASSDRLQADI
ncbi:hypothetical protein EVAR_101814_1 [Eumeta japonica]|uniref:Uncharacterized protein n=1 Tax=Eumeta variegata TaxID=151549 RepID=A0A4C1SQI2_EUMVA|nr:hypothetical protein EVAR_101814_1 [Eumeta japonica]